MSVFDNEIKSQIEDDIENKFKQALIGIQKLPNSSKFGVYLAYNSILKTLISKDIMKQIL